LDILEKDHLASKSDFNKSVEVQSELNKHLEQLLEEQVSQNKAQTELISSLQSALDDLKDSWNGIQQIQKDTSNITSSCKAMIHSFSLADPFDW